MQLEKMTTKLQEALQDAVSFAAELRKSGIDKDRVLSALQEIRGAHRITDENPEEKFKALEKYGQDITEQAARMKLDPVIGRDREIRRLMQVLSRRTKNNPVLIGEAGVGKTAIVEGLAQRIVADDVPEGLKGKRIVALDLGSLVAAAVMSARYITERRLPDKAVDLVDEAAARLRIEIDSMPADIDAGIRKIMQLEIERQALKREKAKSAQEKLKKIENELEPLKRDLGDRKKKWEAQKAVILKIQGAQEKIEALKNEARAGQ